MESHAALVNLQNNMLQPAYHNLPLADVAEALESQLASRRPTINAALARPSPTLHTVVASLLNENLVLAAGAPGGASAALGAGLASVDKDGHATTLAPFKILEAAMPGYNLLTEVGRRDALAAALAPGNLVLVLRVVLRELGSADRMATRNPMLGAFSGLRPHFHEYLNWFMRVNIATGVVNPRLQKYEFASLTDRKQLDHLTALQLDKVDLVSAPHGTLGYFHRRDALAKPLHVDPRDYYVIPNLVTELAEFGGRLLEAIGLPQTLPAGAVGYTFSSFCLFYVEKLKLAGRLPLLRDQYQHMADCDEQFRSALACIKITLQAVVGHTDVGSQIMQIALLADDSEPIARLKQLEADVDRKVQARLDLAGLLPSTSSAASAVDFHNLRLSDDVWAAAKKSVLKRKAGEREEEEPNPLDEQLGAGKDKDVALPPGVLAGSWKWLDAGKTLICVSGRVWNLKELAKHLGVPIHGPTAPCWPYVLSLCEDKNRSARCDRWETSGHGGAGSPPHKCLSKIDAAALAGTYSQPATEEQKQGTSKKVDWSKAPAKFQKSKKGRGPGGRGADAGRGRGRGRGRQQSGEQSFRRPFSP